MGVKCTIDAYDWTTYIDKCNTGDFDVCLFGWTGDNGDPDNFLNLLANEDIGINVAHYDDEEYKSMLAEAVSLPNGDERMLSTPRWSRSWRMSASGGPFPTRRTCPLTCPMCRTLSTIPRAAYI